MGKRELLIVVAFMAVGVLAFRLAAPASPEGGGGFSLERLASLWRRHGTLALEHAKVTTQGQMPVPAGLTTIRLSGLVSVDVRGEERGDLAWELSVEANGPDDAAARAAAAATVLQTDNLGEVMAMSVRAPGEARQAGTLVLRVPAGLGIRVESARRTAISGVATVRLENLVGDAEVRAISGAVHGAHRNGTLLVEQTGDVTLTLATSEATFRAVRGTLTIAARNGSTRIEQPLGVTSVEVNGQSLTVIDSGGEVHASGLGGEITIERPRASVEVDVRRMRVSLLLDRAVPTTVFTTEAGVELTLPSTLPIALDVASESGSIDATAIGLTTERNGDGSRLSHTFGNEARVAIRSQRSSIVIKSSK